MKFIIQKMKKRGHIYILACALIAPLLASSLSHCAQKTAESEDKAIKILKEFMDTKSHKTGSFEHYAQELIVTLKDDPQFAELCKTLQSIKKSKDPFLVGTALKKFKTDRNLSPRFKELFKQSPIKLLHILKNRMSKK
jgi:hypothetical protein